MSYSLIYYLAYFSIVFLLFPYFIFRKQQTNGIVQVFCGVVFIFIASVYFGFRDVHTGSDTANYTSFYYEALKSGSLFGYLKMHNYSDVFFYGILYYCSKWISLPIFFTLISFGLLINYILFASTKYKEELFPFVISLLGFFFVFNLNTNIIRSGFALSLFFLFLFFREKRKNWCWLFLIASLLSHLTICILIVSFFISKLVKKTQWYYYFWFVALFMAIAQIGIQNISFIQAEIAASEKFSVYLNNTYDYQTGFRWNFTIFNFIFIVMGLFAYRKKEKPFYFRMYLLCSAIFLLWYELPFSDRVGLYSWVFIPFIVVDFSRMNLFRNRHVNYWVYYTLIIFLGFLSFNLISK